MSSSLKLLYRKAYALHCLPHTEKKDEEIGKEGRKGNFWYSIRKDDFNM